MPYGRFTSDYGGVVNFERLKRERREKAKKSIQKYNLDGILCLLPENCRYLTVGPAHTFYRYVTYSMKDKDDEPILHESGMIERAIRLGIPGVKTKVSVALPLGLLPSNAPAYNRQLSKFVAQIKEELSDFGILSGKIGIDVPDQVVIDALRKEGINISTDGGNAMREARAIKTKDEIELLRMGCAIVEGCFQTAREVIKPGITEQQVWGAISKTAFELGAEGLVGGHVSSGPHSYPIANTISDRIIRPGDIILIDVYDLSFHGYKTCYYRTFSCGKPTKAQREAWEKARDFTWESIKLLKPGVSTKEFVEKWPKAEEFGYEDNEDSAAMAQWCHGIGLTLYEAPMLSRIWGLDYPEEFQEGMVFAVETQWPTYEKTPAYPQGQCLRIEEEVCITKDGYDVLSQWPIDEITECW